MTTHRSMNELFPTTRDGGQVGDVTTGQSLLEQAGFVRRTAAGIYAMMPLGFGALDRIERIIYEEMDKAGVLNVRLPLLHAQELFELTERWAKYMATGSLFATVEQHQGGSFALAPTAEEIVTATVALDLQSYRQLPLIVHQIGTKFRDELRPRGGLLRGREFGMSDAYSFDQDEEAMAATYAKMIAVYERIFERIGLTDLLMVQADSGAIGGDGSAEFILPSPVGDVTLLTCDACGYGANVEKCDSIYPPQAPAASSGKLREVATPGVKTIAELCKAVPELDPTHVLKTLVFVDRESDYDGLVAVCIRGDLDVSPARLSAEIGHTLQPAAPVEVLRATGVEVGSLGPIGLRGVDRMVFDSSVEAMRDLTCGANHNGRHLVNVNLGVDVPLPSSFHRVHAAADGHACPKCGGRLAERRGIEVGHVFQLGLKYSKPLGIEYIDESGKRRTPYMGCFGIGTTRLLQAVAEDRHDDNGLMWPSAIAPYDVYVVVTRPDDPAGQDLLARYLEQAHQDGITALVDDRSVRPGRKFADADLIGIPTRVTIGRDAVDGKYEIRDRKTGETALAIVELDSNPV